MCEVLKKICTKCGVEKDLPSFSKNKSAKYGVDYICKICKSTIYKIRLHKGDIPIVKCIDCGIELYNLRQKRCRLCAKKLAAYNQRIRTANLASKDPDYFKKLYARFGERDNFLRRDKYNTNEEYREKKINSDRRYTASGRRKELYIKNRETELMRNKKYRENNPDKIKSYMLIYRNENKEFISSLYKATREELKNCYIAQIINNKNKTSLSVKDIPIEIIEQQRLIVKIKRELKKQKK